MSLYLGTTPIATNSSSRNIGEIVASTIPLSDAGLHLLDGGVIQGGGSYSDFVDYIAELYNSLLPTARTVYNVNIVGSLTNNNGVLSGFSTSNYAILPKVFNPNSDIWEIHLKFTTGTIGTRQKIFAHNSGADYRVPTINIETNGELSLNVSTNGSSWAINKNQNINQYVLTANTTYEIVAEFSGNYYVLKAKSSSESSYTTVLNYSLSEPFYQGVLCQPTIGYENYGNGTYTFNGTVDLNSSYINIDGQRWWSGTTQIIACFTDEDSWQASVTQYGVCGKFVYDSSNNTVRLPKITGFTEGTTDVTALGDLTTAGLPNISGSFSMINQNPDRQSYSGAFKKASHGNYPVNGIQSGSSWNEGWGSVTENFDASSSNSIYGNSTTVQPQSIKALYYIVIATSTKTSIEVDIDEVMTDLNGKASLTDLNGKASTDLSNTSNIASSFKSDSVGWGLPKYSALVSISSGYTATSKGFIFVSMNGTGHNTNSININGTRIAYSEATNAYQEAPVMVQIPVDSGDKITWSGTSSVIALFCPAKGV